MILAAILQHAATLRADDHEQTCVTTYAGVGEAFKHGGSILWDFSASHPYHFNQESTCDIFPKP